MPEQLTKWSLTSGTVVKHMGYGLRVQVPTGEIGVVDRAEIGDGYVDPADWPAAGSVVAVVGAGYAGRQLRLSTRPSHIEEARARAAARQSAMGDAQVGGSGEESGLRPS
jgi:hypothetical protein